MSVSQRIAVLVILTAIALLSSSTFAWPMREFSWHGQSFLLSGKTLLGLIACALACSGTEALMRSHPKVEQSRRSSLRCISPTIVTVAVWVLLARMSSFTDRVVGVTACTGVLALLTAVEYYTVDPAARGRAVVQLVTYPVAALLYGIGHLAALDVNAARVTVVVSALLGLRLLGEEPLPLHRILCASLGVAFLLGAVAWLLHPQIASPMVYSLTLVVFFYVLVGLARHFLWGRLQRGVVLEYGLVALVALALLSFCAR